jgi:hypothetical protein
VAEFLKQKLKNGGSYEISSFDRYSGSIHWYGDCDRTKQWLLWRPVLRARQRLLREVTASLSHEALAGEIRRGFSFAFSWP